MAAAGSAASAVHIVYVARGDTSFAPTAAAIAQVQSWSTSPERLHFIVLAGARCLAEVTAAAAPAAHLHVINATDEALRQRLRSAVARAWLSRTLRLGGKQHTYTVPKLFLNEILPDYVEQAITLDADVVALSDVVRLADKVSASVHMDGDGALFYAAEQQNKYRWTLNWTLASSPWPTHRNGVNGGVGVQRVDRLRTSEPYRQIMWQLLEELDNVIVGGSRERSLAVNLGDQTAFSAAAVVAPVVWARLARELPCEWNWQTCVWSYGRTQECPLHEGRLELTKLREMGYEDLNCSSRSVLHDGSCHHAPRLLHFDCPGDLKALLVGAFREGDASLGVNHTAFSASIATPPAPHRSDVEDAVDAPVAELQRALSSPRAAAMCRRADARLIGTPPQRGLASATFCNASFLLSRIRHHMHAGRGSPATPRRLAAEDASKELPAAGPWSQCVAKPPGRLPRVYVYDEELAPLARNPFGFSLDAEGTTAASGPTFVNAVHARLLAAAERPSRPEDAELFFIPESAANDSRRCASLAERLDDYWRRRSPALNYFRRRHGADHLTVSHFRAALLTCTAWHTAAFSRVSKLVGVMQSPWFVEGQALPIPDHRLPRRPFFCAEWMHACPWLPNETRATTEVVAARQHVIEVPYGGSVHGADSWRASREKRWLAVAAFNSRGHRNYHRQMELRRALLTACAAAASGATAKAQPSACRIVDFQGRYTLANTDDPRGNDMLLETISAYRRATFSLQPAGDDPARKGIIDSVTSGCIPVLFYPQQRQLWPLHWGDWVADATVLLPAGAVLNGSLDVLSELRAIPPSRVARMQEALRHHAHKLHYAFVGSSDATGDALEISLERLGAEVEERRCLRRRNRAGRV